MFLKTLKQTIEKEPLGRLALVALSGGADSVALLLGLHALQQNIEAVHCNFHLRGEESDADEQFVRELCTRLNISLHCVDFDTVAYAKLHKISIEMAARELRYAFFEQLRQKRGATAICVAHHQDDNVETMLLNLMRGSGLKGLCGMKMRHGYILRPLLNQPQSALLQYLEAQDQPYRVDSTNADTKYRRNKVRHELLPLLRAFNPKINETLAQTMVQLTEAQSRLDERMTEVPRNALSFHQLKTSVSPISDVYDFLLPYGFTPALCRQIAMQKDWRTGAMYESEAYLCVSHDHELVVAPRPVIVEACALDCHQPVHDLPNHMRLHCKVLQRDEIHDLRSAKNCVLMDAASVVPPLYVRSVQNADRFTPLGMRGSQLVSDYMTNKKRNRIEKLAAVALFDQKGMVWLINERMDHRVRVTPTTNTLIQITCEELK